MIIRSCYYRVVTANTCSLVESVREKMWMVAVAFLTRKMMMGEMMRTSRRMAIPRACCWLAAFSSLLTVSLKEQNKNYIYLIIS